MIVESTQGDSALWERFEAVAEDQRRDVSVEVVRKLRLQREFLDESLKRWVAEARTHGATWSDIGGALGISHQAASQRFGLAKRTLEVFPSGPELWNVPVGPTQVEGADVPR